MKKYFVILGLILALTIGGASNANATCQHTQRTLSELVYLKYYDEMYNIEAFENQLGDSVVWQNWYPMYFDSTKYYQDFGIKIDSNWNHTGKTGYDEDGEYNRSRASFAKILRESQYIYSRGALSLFLRKRRLPNPTWSFFVLDTNKVYYTEEDIDSNLVNFRAKMDEIKSLFGSYKIMPDDQSNDPGIFYLIFDNIANIGEAVNCLNQYTEYPDSEIGFTGITRNNMIPIALTVETTNTKQQVLNIHPNPATNQLRIHLPEIVSESYTLDIYNLAGNAIITQLIPNQGTDYTLNISTLPKGVYFINLSGYTAKFIKE